MNNLKIISLIFVSLLITSCATKVKEPEANPVAQVETYNWDSLPIDTRTDEEFFNSVEPFPPANPQQSEVN